MPCPAFRLALLALSIFSLLDLRAETVSRTPPEIYRQQIAALLTPLEEVLAHRDAFMESNTHGIKLLDEYVRYRDEAGVDYVVFHDVFLARTPEAKEVMSNRIYYFDREHDSIFLVSATTISPSGERQELDDKVAFIQTPQHEAQSGLYTSQQELNLIFPNIVPGAVTEAIVVIRVNTSVFPGEFATNHIFAAGWPTPRSRFVADLPTDFAPRVSVLASSPKVPEKVTEVDGSRTRWIWTRENVNETTWEESSPALRFREPTVWLSSVDSWDRIAAWFSGLTEGRDALSPELAMEVDRNTEGFTDRWSIVTRLGEMVSNEVRYTGLEFGLAGYQPYPCSDVWAKRYGDCKDKANLLRAMLARKGIGAKFVFLNSSRMGFVEKRSPSWKQFNHVILAVDDGAGGYRYCDPTIRFLPAGLIGSSDAAREVLIVDGGTAEWRRTPDLLDKAIRYSADLTLSPAGEIEGWLTIRAEGSDAGSYADYYGGFKPSDRQRSLQRTIEAFYPGAEVIDVDFKPATRSLDEFEIRAYILRKDGAASVESLPFAYPASWLPSVDTSGDRKYPYEASRRIQSFDAKVKLPPGWHAAQPPADFKADSAAAHFEASWRAEENTVRMSLNWHPAAAVIPAGDYALLQRSVRSLRTWLEKPVQIARGTAPEGGSAAVVDDFPLLATGEGQMRLLAERFPMGQRNEERRAALKQVLQWFPEDVDTTFTAHLYIAQIDFKDDNAGFARRCGEILSDYGARPPKETCAWAQYLQYRASWWSSKDPAALHGLKDMSADSTLSDYRRSWCAYYAALFLGESDPAAALGLLAEWDTDPIEARDDILKSEAGYLSSLADPAITAAWAERIIKAQPSDADRLIATMLGRVQSQKGELPFVVLAHYIDAISPVVSDSTRFEKTISILADLKTIADGGRRRSDVVKELSAWIESNPRPWITREKSGGFADLAALEKHLEAMNDAHDGKAVVDASFQLVRFHPCDYVTFTKYLYWAAWWLENQQLDIDLLAELARLAYTLPNEGTENVGEIWLKHAEAERDAGRHDAARAAYEAIIAFPDAKGFQRVEASGELGLMELGLNSILAAQAAFDITIKEHLSHRRGSEYLTVAAVLSLELGDWAKARLILDELAKSNEEYRNDTRYSVELEYLLKSHAKPDVFQAFWERGSGWRPEWDRLLERHGVTPAPPGHVALIANFGELEGEIADAAKRKDVAAYLRKLESLARLARLIPICTINFCNQANKAGDISGELHKELMEVALLVVTDFPRIEDSVYWDTQMWKVALLTDLGRSEEACTAARSMYLADGPGDVTKTTALGIWLTAASRAGSTSEPIGIATALLEGSAPVKNRTALVGNLSDAYSTIGEIGANISLLAREVNHPDVIADSSVQKNLTTRLDGLRRENKTSEDFTNHINAWLAARKLTFLFEMPPASLSSPRYGNGNRTEIYDTSALSPQEVLKCNLLLALDEHRPMDLRHRAFAATVSATSFHVPSGDDYVKHIVSAAGIESLPDVIRNDMLSRGLGFLARTGNRSASKLLDGASGPEQRESLQKAYEGSLAIVATLHDYSVERAGDAFQKGTSLPMGVYEASLIRVLLTRMVLEGDGEAALALIGGATSLNIVASSGQSAAGVRLDWTRHVRRETTNLPFYGRVRDILVRHCAPSDSDAETFRNLTWLISMQSLGHEARAKAIAAVFERKMFSQVDPLGFISMLSSARTFLAAHPSFGLELETAILESTELDDSTRAQWLDATVGVSDIDKPEVFEAIGKAMDACLARTDPSVGPATRQAIRTRFAVMALRTSLEEKPEALFGAQAARDIGESVLRSMQLVFHCSRNQRQAALSLVERIDADQLAQPLLYPYATALLESEGNTAELDLLKFAAREGLTHAIPGIWLDATSADVDRFSTVAVLLGDRDSISANAFAQAESRQVEEFDLEMIKMARARMNGDWKEQLRAATAMLRGIPDFYEASFYRGEALHHLGDHIAARPDLEIFMKMALNSDNRPIAAQILGTKGE